jgi:predicted lipoprotein with Yx(FWY)xxD motif
VNTTAPASDRTGTRAAVIRIGTFVAVLAVTATVGWLAGHLLASPSEQSADEPSAAAMAQEHQGHPQEQQDQPRAQHHHGSGGLQLWATQTASLGLIALDGAGRILYRSDADANNPPVSRCTGECTQRWVPVTLPEGQEPDLLGIKPEQIGTLRREDGTLQVTLAGWPLYTAPSDQRNHDGTGANGAEGTWFAITPTGEKATP